MKELIGVLEQQLRVYSELLEIAQSKRPVIIRNETNALEEMVGREKECLAKISALEKNRVECVKQAAQQFGVSEESVTLSFLTEKAERAHAIRLNDIGQKIRKVVNSIRESNDINSKLLETSLHYIDFMMNFAASTEQISNIYAKGGDQLDTKATTLGLFDKQI